MPTLFTKISRTKNTCIQIEFVRSLAAGMHHTLALALALLGCGCALDGGGTGPATAASGAAPRAALLRLRGGKRGRNSVVVGKAAHRKRQSAWTHFTGGEAFGDDAGAGPRAGKPPSGPKLPGGRRAAAPAAPAWQPSPAPLPRAPATAAGTLYARACDAIRRLGVTSVLELGCSDGRLLQRALARFLLPGSLAPVPVCAGPQRECMARDACVHDLRHMRAGAQRQVRQFDAIPRRRCGLGCCPIPCYTRTHHASAHARTHARSHARSHARTRTHTRTHIHTRTRAHTHTYIRTRAHTQALTPAPSPP